MASMLRLGQEDKYEVGDKSKRSRVVTVESVFNLEYIFKIGPIEYSDGQDGECKVWRGGSQGQHDGFLPE